MAGENQKEELDGKICAFCLSSENNWLELGAKKELQHVVTHYYCLLLSSEMEQKGEDNDGILGFLLPDIKKEITRGKKQKCAYCNQRGATIRCTVSKCKKNFHLPCGIKNNSLHQFYGTFKSFCGTHRPVQRIPANLTGQLAAGLPCGVCLDELPKRMSGNIVWAPCCRKGAWFHRQCVQRLAINAGYFFKCPLCNDKEKFNKTMLDCGIFIPEQDASWETVPHAFEELLHRHSTCDHPTCRDPLGRTNNLRGTRWEVILCDMCGSQGVHMACGQLSWSKPEFECEICQGSRTNARERATIEPAEGIANDSSDQESQESRPLSPPTSPMLEVESPIPFTPTGTPVSIPISQQLDEEEGTTPPHMPTVLPPLISGPFLPQPVRRRTTRGRPPLKKIQPIELSPAQPNTPYPNPIENVFIALQHPSPTPKYDFYEPDPEAASGSSILSGFTVVGGHVFQPKSFSESVSITPPLPPAVRILNQSPTKVSTTVRSTLFPQSQGRVASAPAPLPADIIDLIDDSDDDIEIIEDKRSSVKELVTLDGAKIPVVKVPVIPIHPMSPADRGSPDIEIIETSNMPPRKSMFVRRTTASVRSQENLSPLRLALELPLAAGQPPVPEPQTKPGHIRMLAPRRVRPILPASQPVDPKVKSRQADGTEWSGSPANDDNGRRQNSNSSWQVPAEVSPKRIRLHSSVPSNSIPSNVHANRRSRDPPSYEETIKNDKSQARFLPLTGDGVEAAGGSAAAGSYFITDPAANFGNLLDGSKLYTVSRTAVSSYMLTAVGSIAPGAAQQSMSVGGNDPSSQRRRLECDPGFVASADANCAARQTASAACARSKRQTIGAERHVCASKAVGSADLPRSDHNRLINLRTVSFKILQPSLVKMTGNFYENVIPLTSPVKKILIPVKPTVFCDENVIAVKMETQAPPKPKLRRAKRGAAFARPDDPTKPRKRRSTSKWSKGCINSKKKKLFVVSTSHESVKPETKHLAPIVAIVSSSSGLSTAEGLSLDMGCSLTTESGPFANSISPTIQKSSLPKLTPAPKNSPSTQNILASRHSTDAGSTNLATSSVRKQLFATERPIRSTKSSVVENPKNESFSQSPEESGQANLEEESAASSIHLIGEGTSETSVSPAVKQHLSSCYKMYRQKNFDSIAINVQGQCLTRRTRSVMKAASYSTRSKVSLQKYNFKQGSNDYVPLLRKGYIPKNMKLAAILPKVSTVTSATLHLEADVVQPSSSGKLAAGDTECQKSEAEREAEESSLNESIASFSDKFTNIENLDGKSCNGVQLNLEKGIAKMRQENTLDDLISEDEDFYSSHGDTDNIDDEDDLVFIKRTMKEYKKINQISTLKAKALTARKFRPASDTEKMQREMLLKLRELPATIGKSL